MPVLRKEVVMKIMLWIGLAAITICGLVIGFLGLTGLTENLENGCVMTYMYPNYVPIVSGASKGEIVNSSISAMQERDGKKGSNHKNYAPPKTRPATAKYGLYFYREGWKHASAREILQTIKGVPVLFIPGNGGSYRQARSMAAESERLFSSGIPGNGLYKLASPTPQEADQLFAANFSWARAADRVSNRLDWFMVDLAEEQSALDAKIAEEQTSFVVLAVNKILELYEELAAARGPSGAAHGSRGSWKGLAGLVPPASEVQLPCSVVLVGHSMGGAIARAAAVHPSLKPGSVHTIITLASPHIAPPLASQPALVSWLAGVNRHWVLGFQQPGPSGGGGKREAPPLLASMVVASIAGGTRDRQVRSGLADLATIVPPGRHVSGGTTSMPFVWLSTDHQSIVWCNQLVVQVAAALLRMVDPSSGQMHKDPNVRHSILATHFRSPIPQAFGWLSAPSPVPSGISTARRGWLAESVKNVGAGGSSDSNPGQGERKPSGDEGAAAALRLDEEGHLTDGECPPGVTWIVEPQDTDIFVETALLTVIAVDGRRRWMDIQAMTASGRDHLALVTNLLPCTGIRIHLWREKGAGAREELRRHAPSVDVTMHMLPLPSGPPAAPGPGAKGRLQHPSPTGLLLLSSAAMEGFRFLTISIAPRSKVPGAPRVEAAMAMAQFYRGPRVTVPVSTKWLLSSALRPREVEVEEGHALLLTMALPLSPGMLPLRLRCNASRCGQAEGYKGDPQVQPAGEPWGGGSCKVGCFPPLAVVWDPHTRHEVVLPALGPHAALLATDSPPAVGRQPLLGAAAAAAPRAPAGTLVLLLDPHCSYRLTVDASLRHAALHFLLSHAPQIAAMAAAVSFFGLFQQARAWEQGLPLPSVPASLAQSLAFPAPSLPQCLAPLASFLTLAIVQGEPPVAFEAAAGEALVALTVATAGVAVLALATQGALLAAVRLGRMLAARVGWLREGLHALTLLQYLPRSSHVNAWLPLKPSAGGLLLAGAALLIVMLHPALGLLLLLPVEMGAATLALSRHIEQSSGRKGPLQEQACREIYFDQGPLGSQSPSQPAGEQNKSWQEPGPLDVFRYQHSALLLHLLATACLLPSLVASLQSPAFQLGWSSRHDWVPSLGIAAHAYFMSNFDSIYLFLPPSVSWSVTIPLRDKSLSMLYATAGVASFFAALKMAPSAIVHTVGVVGPLAVAMHVSESRKGRGMKGTSIETKRE